MYVRIKYRGREYIYPVNSEREGWQIGFDFWKKVESKLQGLDEVIVQLIGDEPPIGLSNIDTGPQDLLKRVFGD
ncbi:hypothetical protein NIES4074_18680 [Cylindrospermum sp. NIES-4074]|nr:hypothetical protein NIES4074_18680 [Cylindrospermum sp. NIES-4074]